jgi:NTP pyrophosphatase (non-canonical NTP hydrolase)
MQPDHIDINALKKRLSNFCDERGWRSRNGVRNLAMAASVEMGEILEVLQWLNEEEAENLTVEQKGALSDEIADTINNLVMLADVLEINLSEAIAKKIQKNAIKYPATG